MQTQKAVLLVGLDVKLGFRMEYSKGKLYCNQQIDSKIGHAAAPKQVMKWLNLSE